MSPEDRILATGATIKRITPARGRQCGSLRLYTATDAALAPPRRHLLRGILAEGEIGLFYGAPKCGKSFFATRLLYGATLGLGFGDHDATRPLRCIYVAAEGEHGFAGRIVALRDRFGDPNDDFIYIAQRVCVGPPGNDLADLIRAAREMRADVIGLDTVARTFGEGDENSTRDMSLYVAALDKLRDEAREAERPFPAIVLIHHGPKHGDGSRGSIALPAAADCIVRVERRDNSNVAIVEAAKDDADGTVIPFKLTSVEIGRDDDGAPRRTCIADPAERTAATPAVSPQKGRALGMLHDVVAGPGGADLPNRPGFPRGFRGAPVTAWQRECDARGLAASDDPDTRRRVFQRIRRDLADAGLIAERDGIVWALR
jgi:hypothetical protein